VLQGTVLVVAESDRNLRLASGNVPGVRLTTGQEVSTYNVLWPDKILFTEESFRKLEARLGAKEVA
jgi:ribosomal protein L4